VKIAGRDGAAGRMEQLAPLFRCFLMASSSIGLAVANVTTNTKATGSQMLRQGIGHDQGGTVNQPF
jgi:hypothetical protein